MTPEELALTRVLWAQNRGRTIQFIEDDKMSRAAFELQNRVPMLLDHIDAQAAQIDILKEKLVEERAQKIITEMGWFGFVLDSETDPYGKAHEQLKAEMPEVVWDDKKLS